MTPDEIPQHDWERYIDAKDQIHENCNRLWPKEVSEQRRIGDLITQLETLYDYETLRERYTESVKRWENEHAE